MRNWLNNRGPAILCAALLIAAYAGWRLYAAQDLAAAAESYSSDEVIESHEAALPADATLDVVCEGADLQVSAWDRPAWRVRVLGGGDRAASPIIVTRGDRAALTFAHDPAADAITLEIRIPANCDLNLSIADGDLDFQGVDGQHCLLLVGGDASIEDVSGSVHIDATTSDVRIADAQAKVVAAISGGELRVTDLGGDLCAHGRDCEIAHTGVSGTVVAELERDEIVLAGRN